MKKITSILFSFSLLAAVSTSAAADELYNTGRPRLLLTEEGVANIKASAGEIPAFDASVAAVKESADNALAGEIVVPIPVDGGGGYTHEQHKQNYYNMYHCGIMYQLDGNEEYAEYVKKMFYEYAAMYTTLPEHPDPKSNSKGRLFWQSLNDYVWLVHVANAYDCVYTYLSQQDRDYLEKELFYPVIDFLSNSSPMHRYGFDRMHNHGTWATTAVGMLGYIMNDKDLVEKAFYGLDKDGKTGGFYRQLDFLFSPDGYYTEGAYYQRYSLWPFVVFAQVVEHNEPERDIYNYRNGTIKKATDVVLQHTYNMELLNYNDAMAKSLEAQEIVNAINASYAADTTNKELLSIAQMQGNYIVSAAGLTTARAVAADQAEPFKFRSLLSRDGADGTQGGIAIIRAEETADATTLVFKATSHGLSHGHYDKLGIAIYDNGYEILPDYGSSRFLNIVTKNGGQYTDENISYARQTIAHNTVTVDMTSHFGGEYEVSSLYAPSINFFGVSDEGDKKGVQIVSAKDTHATEGVTMNRTVAMIETGDQPLIIDIFRLESENEHTYDLPFNYNGHIISTDFKLSRKMSNLAPFGTAHGYQHLWVEAEGAMNDNDPLATFTWVKGNRFYSVNSLASQDSKFYQVLVGANDPDENLHKANAIVVREQAANHTFVSTIEPHGLYDLLLEVTSGYTSNVADIETLVDNAEHTIVKVSMFSGIEYTLCVQNAGSEATEDAENVVKADNGQEYKWTGDYALFTHYATK